MCLVSHWLLSCRVVFSSVCSLVGSCHVTCIDHVSIVNVFIPAAGESLVFSSVCSLVGSCHVTCIDHVSIVNVFNPAAGESLLKSSQGSMTLTA